MWIFDAILKTACAIACGYLDRYRGSKTLGFEKVVDSLLYGFAVGVLLDLSWHPLLAFTALFATGMSYGYTAPWSAALHARPMVDDGGLAWWQVGLLRDNATAALVVRGALLGLTVLPVALYERQVAPFAVLCCFSFVLAVRLARAIDHLPWPAFLPTLGKGVWDKAEACRGWLLGLAALAAGVVY